MSEKVLGALHVIKKPWDQSKETHERLIFTSERLLVVRKWVEHQSASAHSTSRFTELLLRDKINYSIQEGFF